MTTEILRNQLYRVGDDGTTAEERLQVRGLGRGGRGNCNSDPPVGRTYGL